MSTDRRDGLIALIVFAVALWVNLAAVPTTEFHRDEPRWIHRARFVGELTDPTGPYWRSRELMWGQPPLGSYITGWGLLAQGRDILTNDLYNFHYGEAWNRRHGTMPDERDLLAARRTNSVVGALLAVGVYFIARGLGGRVAGLVAAVMLIPHPLAIYLSSLAGSDAALGLALAGVTLAAMALADRPTWPRAVLLGVLLGLGAAIKLSPLPMTLPFVGLGLVLLWQAWRAAGPDQARARARSAAIGWKLLPLPAVAFATFVATFPYLWPDPIGRTLVLFRFRAKEMFNQGEIWPELNVNGPVDALSRVGNWFGDLDSTTGRLGSLLAWSAGVDWQPNGIDLPLALVGALLLAAATIRHGLASRQAMAALVLGSQVGLVVVGMRADFARYLLPVLTAQAVCIGLAAGGGWDLLRVALTRPGVDPLADPEPEREAVESFGGRGAPVAGARG